MVCTKDGMAGCICLDCDNARRNQMECFSQAQWAKASSKLIEPLVLKKAEYKQESKLFILSAQLETMKAYLKLRYEMSDYHGIRDACTDIEILIGQIEVLKGEKK